MENVSHWFVLAVLVTLPLLAIARALHSKQPGELRVFLLCLLAAVGAVGWGLLSASLSEPGSPLPSAQLCSVAANLCAGPYVYLRFRALSRERAQRAPNRLRLR